MRLLFLLVPKSDVAPTDLHLRCVPWERENRASSRDDAAAFIALHGTHVIRGGTRWCNALFHIVSRLDNRSPENDA